MAWRRARDAGGRFLLRIEDIDQGRSRPEFAAAIEADLRWLGLDWDGPVRVQSAHLREYRAALGRLRALDVLYPCFCSRADIAASGSAPHGPEGPLYPGTCRDLPQAVAQERIASGAPHAFRLNVGAAMRRAGPLTWFEEGEGRLPCDCAMFGDPVLSRRDAPGSYHLCVTHDDALQGVNLVTRGEDLRPATSLHRLLQTLLGWPEPAYAHHKLLVNAAGRRYAKRDHDCSLQALRAKSWSAADVQGRIALTA